MTRPRFTEPEAIGSAYGVSPRVVRCLTCFAVIMPTDRDAHAAWHEDGLEPAAPCAGFTYGRPCPRTAEVGDYCATHAEGVAS